MHPKKFSCHNPGVPVSSVYAVIIFFVKSLTKKLRNILYNALFNYIKLIINFIIIN